MGTPKFYDVLSASPRAGHSKLLGQAKTAAEADALIRASGKVGDWPGTSYVGAELMIWPEYNDRVCFTPKYRDHF